MSATYPVAISVVLILGMPAYSQTSATASSPPPLDITPGYWTVTSQTTAFQKIDAAAWLKAKTTAFDATPQAKDEAYRNSMMSMLKATAALYENSATKGDAQAPKTASVCITDDALRKGQIIDPIPGSCSGTLNSTSNKVSWQATCQRRATLEMQWERVDAMHLKGTMTYFEPGVSAQDFVANGGTPDTTIKKTYSAALIAPTCPTAVDLARTQGLALGANPDVLAFMPYIPPPAMGKLGRNVVYSWARGPAASIPYTAYAGGLTTAKLGNGPTNPVAYFHGTDGQFVYFTFPDGDNFCVGQKYKFDRAGTPTAITVIPAGLKGGRDQLSGPCR